VVEPDADAEVVDVAEAGDEWVVAKGGLAPVPTPTSGLFPAAKSIPRP
jgi:hypothetical protein